MEINSITEDFGDIDLNQNKSNNKELAVDVSHVHFGYNKMNPVLKDVNLQIPNGKIFALLGPNGTGKTTLMRSILGRLKIKSGSIRVFGVRAGSKYSDIPGPGAGYMPQELALFEEFSIQEILKYYGTIYHLSDKEVNKRVEELTKLLNLPEKSRIISRLSGGQQRRVSIAITMIHRPKLIILDEPTVGVDSLLRHRIWKYLEECCLKHGQTVLITTHYIEEAKSAANIAFMSYGTILLQSSPQKLLEEYNCSTLESVFLQLCQQTLRDRKSVKPSELLNKTQPTNNEKVVENTLDVIKHKTKGNKSVDFSRVKAMLHKYYTLSVRRPVFLYLFYFMPFITLTAVHFALGQYPANIPMVIVNEDLDPEYSQIIIDSIDKHHIDLKMASNNESAFESVVNGTNYMSVYFGKNFTETFEYRVKDLVGITDEELELSEIKVYVDFSNAAMGIFVLKYLLRAFNTFLNKMSEVFGSNAYRFFHIVHIEEPIYGEFEFDLEEVFGPGILLALCQTLPMLISALQIVFDRKNSSLERILVAGVKPIEIFLAHLIQNILLIGTQLVFTLLITFVLYGVTQKGSYFDVYSLLFLTGIQGMVIGLFLAILLEDEVSIMAGAGLLILPLWIISGVFWPIEAIPLTLREVIKFSPICQPLQALRSIMLRGWAWNHPGVYIGYIVNLVYIVIISIVDIVLFTKLTK